MLPSEARNKLQESVKRVNWINMARVMDSLASGFGWNKYDNTNWRPNFKQVDHDLPWLLDNWEDVCEALRVLKEARHDEAEGS